MKRHLPNRHAAPLLVAAVVALAWSPTGVLAQDYDATIDLFWNVSSGSFGIDGNWTSTEQIGGPLVPEGQYGEQAIINNQGTATLTTPFLNTDNNSDVGGPGNLRIGNLEPGVAFDPANPDLYSGTLEMSGTGALELVSGPNALRILDVGRGDVGSGARGTLTMTDSSSLAALDIWSGGQADSLISLSGSAALTAENNATLRTMTRIAGSSVDFSVGNDLAITGSSTFISEITSGSHSAIDVAGAASLGGAFEVDFNGVTPSLGDSWDLITASSISGAFASIDVTGYTLGEFEEFSVDTIDNLDGTFSTRLSLQELDTPLTLAVNRGTGDVSIMNAGASAKEFDGYQISSASGTLLSSGWNSLEDQGVSGWEEAVGTASDLVELNAVDTLELTSAAEQPLGDLYPVEFGASQSEDISFSYTDAETGEVVEGIVEYVGVNDMVLTIDPATGEAQIKNGFSGFVANVDAYTITSESGSLLAGNWDSLDDQAAEGGTWDDGSAANGAEQLVELNSSDSTAFDPFTAFRLGEIIDMETVSEEGDLVFQYSLAGEIETRTGFVVFDEIVDPEDPPILAGDYNGDGSVDAADYTVFRDALGGDASVFADGTRDPSNSGAVNVDDYLYWKTNFGLTATSSVGAVTSTPEPAGVSVVAGALLLAGFRRRGR